MVILELAEIVKHFGGVTALDHADFSVEDGEIMALVGDNGAGKSTLIKVISGAYIPDSGTISMRGKTLAFRSPQDAWATGIATIYQELALAEKMTVADNIFLGREVVHYRFGIPFLSRRTMRAQSQRLLNELDVHVSDLDRWVETLSGGQRQGVAIASDPRPAASAPHVLNQATELLKSMK